MQSLARLTGADVAASSDLTGSASSGGDWTLEYSTGAIQVASVGDTSAAHRWSGVLGQAIWSASGDTTPNISDWSGSAFSATSNTASVGTWGVVDGAAAPTRNETIVVGVTGAGSITGQIWNGSTWTALSFNPLATVSDPDRHGVDVAYESLSGDALVVWNNGSTGTAGLSFRTWNGSSWSATQTITAPTSGEPQQLYLAADPTSNEIILLVTQSASDDYALVWNGSSWGNSILLGTATSQETTDSFVAYESTSGQAIVVYDDISGGTGMNYRTWDGASWSSELTVLPPSGTTADPRAVTLASNPTNDMIAMGVVTSSNDVWFSVWNGSSWGSTLLASSTATSSTALVTALAFESQSGDLLATYAESSNLVSYRTWTSGGGWSAEMSGPDIGALQTPNIMTLTADPASNQIMLGVQDSDSDLSFVVWSGSAWGTVKQIEINTGETATQPFVFLYDAEIQTAPVLDSTKSPALTAINEDAGAPSGAVGTLVSSLVDLASPAGQFDNITDPDTGALLGIAVTAADTTNGSWWYSTNGGANWSPLGAVSVSNARLLAADGSTRLYFQPTANWSGSISNAITFRAWDRTSGLNGSTADTSSSSYTVLDQFGTVAFTNNNGTANWASNWVEGNDDGAASTGGALITGGQLSLDNHDNGNSAFEYWERAVNLAGVTSATLSFDFSVLGAVEATDAVVVEISGDGGTTWGTLATFSNYTAPTSGSRSYDITGYASANTKIRFAISDGYAGADEYFTVDNVAVAYATVRTGGATAFSAATDTASLFVSPVADTPTVTNASTSENTQTTNGLVISRNAADGAEVTHFKITGISNGTLYKNDGTTAITNGTFITFAEGSAGLKFTPSANFSGNGGFTVQASTSSGDAGLGGSTASATITVLAVNDAPVAADDTYSVNEDSTLVIAPSTSNLSHWWGFNEGASSQTAADAGSTPNSGTLGSTAGADTTDPTWTTGYVGSGGLSFDGAGDYVATNSTDLKTASTFTISAWFQTDTTTGAHHIVWQGYAGGNGYGNGGSTTSATSEMSLSIGSYTAAYDNKIVFFLGYDVPANGADSIFIASASNFTDTGGWHHVAVSVTDIGGGVMSASLYVDGQLEGTDTGSQNDRSTWDPLRIGASGDGSRSFDGKIDEVRIYQSALTAAQVQALAQPGILQNDTDAELDVLNAVLASGPTNGTLALGKDGSFTYTPNANFSGVDSFTYRANDGTASSNLATVTINVNPVNDAPVATITPATYAATEQVALSLKNTGLSISDVDAASGSMTVTLSVTEGALTVTAGGSGALVSNSGTSSVTITGTVTQINNLLNTDGTSTVSYSDNTNTPSASATLTLQVNDNGNTGGGSLTNSDTATINITPVNDAPTLTATALNPTFTEAAGLGTQAAAVSVFNAAAASTIESGQTITGLTFTVSGLVNGANEVIVVDGRTITLGATSSGTTATNGLAYTATVSGGTATVVLSGGNLTTAATQTLVNGITYQNTSTDNPTAGNRVFTLTQIKDNGGTANGGADTKTLSIGSTVTVNAVNDAPTTSTVTLAAIAEDSGARVITQAELLANASDVDGASLTATNLAIAAGSGTLVEQRQRHLDLYPGAQRRQRR